MLSSGFVVVSAIVVHLCPVAEQVDTETVEAEHQRWLEHCPVAASSTNLQVALFVAVEGVASVVATVVVVAVFAVVEHEFVAATSVANAADATAVEISVAYPSPVAELADLVVLV